MARLLLIIDELRKRIEGMGGETTSSSTPSPEPIVSKALQRVGLKDMAEARSPQRLKGVFERLYQDACQRVTRCSLIRERMIAANALCSQVLAALSQKHSENGGDGIPDFERLNATASAALRGMCYHTDYLFRATCEYAMAQGVQNTLFKAHQTSMQEFMDTLASEDTEQSPESEDGLRRAHRMPGRRGDRLRGKVGARDFCSSPTSPGSIGHFGSPSKPRKPPVTLVTELEQPTSFGQYVAALREGEEEWLRARERHREKRTTPADKFDTLKAACLTDRTRPEGRQGSRPSLAASQSLPALPKGRSFFQSQDSPTASTAASRLSSLSTAESRQM